MEMGRGRRRRSFRGVALILTRGVARGPFPAVEATGHAPGGSQQSKGMAH